MTWFRRRPTLMEAVKWDGETATIGKMLDLGIDFRVTTVGTGRGPVRIGYVILNANRTTQVVDIGSWVTKGKDGWPRVLKPKDMEDWREIPTSEDVAR